MQEKILEEMLKMFNEQCFSLAQETYYESSEDFAYDAIEEFENRIDYIFGHDEDVRNRLIIDYLEKYLYYDPVTRMKKSFMEWSQFFNDEYELKDNILSLYDICRELRQELDECGIADTEDGDEANNIATVNEMKSEAVSRMLKVISYKPVIDVFQKDGLPMVYEPPMGTCYDLEDDEIEKVRQVEKERNIIIWGVVRCFMMYNRKEEAVDCYLHVSSNKEEWEQERSDLFDGYPFVFTFMKSHSLFDYGHIEIEKSIGGTIVRK